MKSPEVLVLVAFLFLVCPELVLASTERLRARARRRVRRAACGTPLRALRIQQAVRSFRAALGANHAATAQLTEGLLQAAQRLLAPQGRADELELDVGAALEAARTRFGQLPAAEQTPVALRHLLLVELQAVWEAHTSRREHLSALDAAALAYAAQVAPLRLATRRLRAHHRVRLSALKAA